MREKVGAGDRAGSRGVLSSVTPAAFVHRTIAFDRAMCTIHITNSAASNRRLEKAGWLLRGVKGSHHINTHPQRGGHISLPHPKKDLGTGLVLKLLKQAGLKKKESNHEVSDRH